MSNEDYEFCMFYLKRCEFDKAAPYLVKFTDSQDPEHQYMLGEAYYYGNGVEESFEKGAHYLQLAASQGHVKAHQTLAYLYWEGTGVEQSYEKAFKCYQFVIDNSEDNHHALLCLGIMYEGGKGVIQSYEKAIEYYQLSKDKNDAIAKFMYNELITSEKFLSYVKNLKKRNQELEKELEELKAHIKYMPDGIGYQEAKEDFADLASTT